MKKPASIYYFGCGDMALGHYWWEPEFRNRELYPSDRRRRALFKNIDAGFAPQPEVPGHAKVTHIDGWTVLAWWDRSVDHRVGSNSALVVEGTYHFADMINLLGTYFTPVAQRQLQGIKCVEEPEFEPCTEA